MIKKKRKPRNYVNNPDLYEAMCAHLELVKKAKKNKEVPPQASRYIGDCIVQICTRLSTKPNFFSYTWREEMIDDAIENCVKAIDNYNTKYNNPFAYFTRIAWNAMIRRIGTEKKEIYLKHKNMQLQYEMDMLSSEHGISRPGDEKSDDVIREFEEKLEANRKKKKKALASKKKGLEKFGD